MKDARGTRTGTQAMKLPYLLHAVCDCLQSPLALPAALLVSSQGSQSMEPFILLVWLVFVCELECVAAAPVPARPALSADVEMR